MYSLGKTIAQVVPAEQRSPSLDHLIGQLSAPTAAARPTAAQATSHAYFAVLYQGTQEEERPCCVCNESFSVSGGLLCSDGRAHFTCSECLTKHVHFASVDELRARGGAAGPIRAAGLAMSLGGLPPLPTRPCLLASTLRRWTLRRARGLRAVPGGAARVRGRSVR